jgi:hypothetical protein
MFLFSTASRPSLGLIQSPIERESEALTSMVKWSEREGDHLPPYSAEVKKSGYISSLPIRFRNVMFN